MSATPIPRTSEMAVSGIREMSTILTPPEERHPVLTFVGPYEEKQISAAIRRELLREGQVFYIHNRVESIDRAARRIRDIVPEARIEIAHGQMGEGALEQIIVDFWEKRFDVLVCTTIVESGLDISNANTLIVERSDMLGLAQLHQLRGRVGRGRDRGYAYFLYPPERPMTETAHDRLATIASHTDLGSGMAVAMKDLEIRGAGNVLGGEQSGTRRGSRLRPLRPTRRRGGVATQGRTGRRARGRAGGAEGRAAHRRPPADRLDPLRTGPFEAYQRLAAAHDDAALAEVREELTDRFGVLPAAVELLFAVAQFRVLVAASGGSVTSSCRAVESDSAPSSSPESRTMRLNRLYPGTIIKPAVRTILVPAPRTSRVGGEPLRGAPLLAWATQLVETVIAPAPPGEKGMPCSVLATWRRPRVMVMVVGAAVLLTGCGQVKAGSAAIVGEQVLTQAQVAEVSDEVNTLAEEAEIAGPAAPGGAEPAHRGAVDRRGPHRAAGRRAAGRGGRRRHRHLPGAVRRSGSAADRHRGRHPAVADRAGGPDRLASRPAGRRPCPGG